ncbi:MAG: hypothetical protein E6J79_21260, partial [Deltaproteobacteria bacterium]
LELTERLGGGPLGEPWIDRPLRWLRPLGVRWTPTGFLNLILRLGPYGDRFLPWSDGLSLGKLKAAPHGIDLGPLQPGVDGRLYHRDKRIHLASPPMLEAMAVLERDVEASAGENGLVLIGRRELRSNNSWMHNLPSLVSGRERCVLYVHPDDAARYQVRDGELAILESRVHRGEVRVAVTDDMRPGVVSLPHGWTARRGRRSRAATPAYRSTTGSTTRSSSRSSASRSSTGCRCVSNRYIRRPEAAARPPPRTRLAGKNAALPFHARSFSRKRVLIAHGMSPNLAP